MKAWKKLEIFVADYLSHLGWIRKKKKHFGDSIWDVEGQGFKGECKHYKAHKIHTIKIEAELKYTDDIIIFTKVKRTHYEPYNVLVTINIELFKRFLECYKQVDNKNIKVVDNKLTNCLRDLEYQSGVIKVSANKMKKTIKMMEEECLKKYI